MAKTVKPESPGDVEALSFEKALEELETIVQKLETGDVDLDQSIALYERGTLLKAHCAAKLSAAQEKIEKISLGSDGAVKSEPTTIS